MNWRKVSTLAVAISMAGPSYAGLEFAGYLRSNGDLQFVVTDVESRTTSRWLKIGDTFREHRVVAFDPKEEVLTLDSAGKISRLRLRDTRVREGSGEPGKVEVRILITSDGNLGINGRDATDEGVRTALQQFAASGVQVNFSIYSSPPVTEKAEQAYRRFNELLRESGLRKWQARIVDTPTSK